MMSTKMMCSTQTTSRMTMNLMIYTYTRAPNTIWTKNMETHPNDDDEHATDTPNTQKKVAKVPFTLALSGIAECQKIDDSWQNNFRNNRRKIQVFFSEGENGVLRRHQPSIPELEQIFAPQYLCTKLLHLVHYEKIDGHPGWTRMFTRLRRTY